MMLDGEVGSTVSTDVAMAVMFGFRLPDVVLGREREPLTRQSERRNDFELRGSDRKRRRRGRRQAVAFLDRKPAFVEIVFGGRLR